MALIEQFIEWLSKVMKWDNPMPDDFTTLSYLPPEAPKQPATAPQVQETINTTFLWDTPKNAFHSTRVICDEMGLTFEMKNILCACIFQESRFNNAAIGRNKDKQGNLLSTDWGIVQCNDYWNIGKAKTFPSVEYVVNNPEKMVRWMIRCYKDGQLNLWASFKSGVYKQWLVDNGPMWKLKV